MRTHASHALFATAVAFAALALGALHTVVLAIVALLLVAALLIHPTARSFPLRRPAMALVLVAVALIAFTALQSVAFPAAVGRVLWPRSVEVWSQALAPLGRPGPSWMAASLDPIATRVEVLRGLVYLSVFLLALRLAAESAGVVFLERVVLASVVLVALLAVIHPALGAERVYGLYRPVNSIDPRHIAPLLNANHLGGYLNIGVCLASGITLSSHPHLPRSVAAATTLFLVGVEVWVASRGGTMGTLIGLALVAWMHVAHRASRERVRGRRDALVTMGALAASIAFGSLIVVLSDDARSELFTADVSKLRLLGQVMNMASRSPLFGVGRGAFESAFPAFRTVVGDDTYTHPENLEGQWLAEWGLVVGPLALFIIAWSLRPRVALHRSRSVAGPWGALVALALQNQVDFSSEVPAVMIALTVCAAITVGGSSGASRTVRPKPVPIHARWSLAQPALAALLALAAIVCFFSAPTELAADQQVVRAAVLGMPKERDRVHEAIANAMLRHPSEPFFPYSGELRAFVARDESVVPWAAAALERSPVDARAHLVLARWLAPRFSAQARFEYRRALEDNPPLWRVCAAEGAPLVHSEDDANELAGFGPLRTSVLLALSSSLAARLPATVEWIERDLVQEGADELAPREALAADALTDAEEPAAWCEGDRARCIHLASDAIKEVETRAPHTCAVERLRARLMELEGKPAEARAVLVEAIRTDPDGEECTVELLAHLSDGPAEVADGVLQTTARSVCPGSSCVRALSAFADFEKRKGNLGLALSFESSAIERGGSDDSLLVNVARLASAQGLHGQSAEAYRKLSLRHPEDGAWAKLAEAERGEALRNGIPLLARPPSTE